MRVCAVSAVEEMESVTAQQQQQQHIARPHVGVDDTAHVELSASSVVAKARSEPLLHSPMSDEEQRFFSENDVDNFLEQRDSMNAVVNAREQMKLDAKMRAEAEARAVVEAQQRAEMEARQAVEMQARLEAEHRAAALAAAEHLAEQRAQAAARAAQEAEARANAKTPAQITAEHLEEVEARGAKLLERAEFLARVEAQLGPSAQPALLEQQAKTQAKAKAKAQARAKVGAHRKNEKAWWQSKTGVATNYHHYKQGMSNSLVGSGSGSGSVTNAASSYSLPLGKKVSQARLNRKKSGQGEESSVMSALEVVAPEGAAPAVSAAVPVATYGTAPVAALAAEHVFDPHSGATFHPPVLQPVYAPKLPAYMAESKQPWAGAGYYGSGGGQGPHPGSEAFVPLPGVSGKEFGIRAREAWEEHAQKHGASAATFHSVKDQPEYPFFPAWSRKTEVGGRPDIFPRPLANLPTVNAAAQRAAADAFRHSNAFYQQFNRQATVPQGAVAAAQAQLTQPMAGVAGPRLLRQVMGYPRPAAQASRWGPVASSFPAPRDSASFSEDVNYAALGKVPTLGVPTAPMDLRNLHVNNGPNRGLQPAFGNFPQYVPVPGGL